ncbi:MAG TPA: hypothetical protein VFK88_13205 [Gallionella sp.]|nr:hypothetical protein [Gallionella sp.]
MKIASLSTDQAPPISVPLRFFAVAPLFLVLAALMLATGGNSSFEAARSPAILAAVHCITLGFMTMIMMGATQQILPVVLGSKVPASAVVAWFTFLPLLAGAILLPLGFGLGKPELFNFAWPLLAVAFLVFIGSSLISLAHAPAQNASKTAILLSILALAGAVTCGVLLARGYATGLALPYAKLATAHVSMALGGWVMLLIIGVSYQVVPMFQLTPNYPKWLMASLAPAISGSLLLNLLVLLPEAAPRWAEIVAESLFWLWSTTFAVVTLRLQNQRRRRVADATLTFFRLGMFSLLCSALLSMMSLLMPATELLRMLAALVFLLGFAMSLIHGMLYKIIPFLVWFHLFRGGSNTRIPNMKEIIPEPWMWRHLMLHGSTLLAALLQPFWNVAGWLVIPGLLLQGILLSYAVFTGVTVYRRTLARIERVPA